MAAGEKSRQPSKPQKWQLPPLQIDDYKVVVRPLDGLNLGACSMEPRPSLPSHQVGGEAHSCRDCGNQDETPKGTELGRSQHSKHRNGGATLQDLLHCTRRKTVPSKTLRRHAGRLLQGGHHGPHISTLV
ncbi:unnamed protein product [Ixodes hexagonus]